MPVYPIGCVTKGRKGEELAEMGDMLEAGARGLLRRRQAGAVQLIMRRALEYSKVFDVPIIDHCEDTVLVDGGVMHEGAVSTRLGLQAAGPGSPRTSWCSGTSCWPNTPAATCTSRTVHGASPWTSSGGPSGARCRVTCEVTPHHIALTDEAVGEYDTDAKMNPPLRAPRTGRRCSRALADGTVDAIATDHAPHHCDEKCVEFVVRRSV